MIQYVLLLHKLLVKLKQILPKMNESYWCRFIFQTKLSLPWNRTCWLMSIWFIGMIRRVFFLMCLLVSIDLLYHLYLCFLEILGPCVVYQVDYWFLSHSQRARSKYHYTRHTLLPIQDVHNKYNDSITSSQIFSKRSTNPPRKPSQVEVIRAFGCWPLWRSEFPGGFTPVGKSVGVMSKGGRKRRSQDGAWLSEDAVDDMAKVGEISSRQWRCWLLGFLHYWERLDVCMVYPSLKLT